MGISDRIFLLALKVCAQCGQTGRNADKIPRHTSEVNYVRMVLHCAMWHNNGKINLVDIIPWSRRRGGAWLTILLLLCQDWNLTFYFSPLSEMFWLVWIIVTLGKTWEILIGGGLVTDRFQCLMKTADINDWWWHGMECCRMF